MSLPRTSLTQDLDRLEVRICTSINELMPATFELQVTRLSENMFLKFKKLLSASLV